MSKNISQLRDERKEYAREANNLLDAVTPSDWKKEEHGVKYNELLNKIDNIDSLIDAHQRRLDDEAETIVNEVQAESKKISGRDMDEAFIRRGHGAFSAEQWAKFRNTNVELATSPDGAGGYTVQSDVSERIIESLKAFGGMREVASQISTSKGNTLSFPTSDYTTEEGEIVAENESATAEDPEFGNVSIGAFKYSSKVVTVSWELLQDSQVDVVGFIQRVIESRLGRIQNKHFTRGAGTTEPYGVITKATDSGVAVNTTTGITYQDILDLQHSVDPAYRQQSRFMFSDKTLKEIRSLLDDQNRPLFVPSYDRSIQDGAPGTLAGSAISINQDVLDLDGTNRFMAFGDFSKYLIRDVMMMTLFRFDDSTYVKKGQVGFLAWLRADGQLLDTGAVKYAAATAS